MKRWLYSSCFVLIFVFSSCRIVKNPPKEKAVEQVENRQHLRSQDFSNFLKEYYLSTGAGGCLLFIADSNGTWNGSLGWRNISLNERMLPDTRFRVGSITKMFISTLVLQLVQENKIGLDDKIVAYLPELKNKIKQIEQMTIRQLLANTSGMIDPPNQSFVYKAKIVLQPKRFSKKSSLKLLKKYVFHKKSQHKPGTAYHYSNAGYWVLGLLIEKIEKQDLAIVVDQKICQVLGLKNTYLIKQKDKLRSEGYTNIGKKKKLEVTNWDSSEADGKAAGGIVSSAPDLHLFMKNLFLGNLINPQLLTEMKRIQLSNCANPECEYGLGLEIWRIGSSIAFGHNGTLIGAESNALYFEKEQVFVVVFKNSGGGSDKRFIEKIIR
jgi:D-alanyl-D-alanine carboxypeptidase